MTAESGRWLPIGRLALGAFARVIVVNLIGGCNVLRVAAGRELARLGGE